MLLNYVKKLSFLSIIALSMLSLLASPVAHALSAPQKKIYDRKIGYFDIDPCQPSNGGQKLEGSVYMVGDSVTGKSKGDLENAFKNQGAESFINASAKRSITKAGTDKGFETSGIEALETDKDRVKNSNYVVIALGAFQRDDNFEQSIKDMARKVKEVGPNAAIYWVNVFSDGKGNEKIDKFQVSKSIRNVSTEADYRVIDTLNTDIELEEDKIHPTAEKGASAFADVVITGMVGESEEKGVQCSCGGGSTSLTGSNEEEQIWNYLTSPDGMNLKPYQAAGVMGNMKAESGFKPQRLQGTPPTKKTPAESLSAAQLSNPTLGWGIVQWTPPGKMINSFSPKSQANDLGNQLKFLKDQLDGKTRSPEKVAGDKLKATKNVTEATRSFELDYERHAGGAQPERIESATDILNRYGSSGGGGGSASSDSTACSTENGEVSGEFSLPVPKSFYNKNPGEFTAPHHDYPAVDIGVPNGTKIFAVAKGKVSKAVNSGYGGGFGTSVYITDDNITYIYAHGTPGSLKVRAGQEAKPGQLLMLSDNSGHSLGAHLHFEIQVSGQKRCPQKLLDAIGKGKTPPDVKSLPSRGCIGPSL